jgi:DNA polymerase-3 subunit delta'
MNKEEFKKTQPVAFRLLSRTLKSRNISHAYLLHGPKGSPKEEIALLFVQSLYSEHPDEDGFACQSCPSCLQTAAETNPDFYWVHSGGMRKSKPLTRKQIEEAWKQRKLDPGGTPDKKSARYRILKDDILKLQETFSCTSALDRYRSYILEQYEAATQEASNSLLKFLEEPDPGLVGILTADDTAAILPTIVSRCQLIPVRPASKKQMEENFLQIIDDLLLAKTFAQAGYSQSSVQKLLQEEPVFTVRDAAQEYWKNRGSHMALVHLQLDTFSKKSKEQDSALTYPMVKLFFELLLTLSMQEEISLPLVRQRSILLESLDALQRPVDLALLIDHACLQIMMSTRKMRGMNFDRTVR